MGRHWGLGVSYMYTKVNADSTGSGFNGSVDWGSNAVLAYATMIKEDLPPGHSAHEFVDEILR
jgi:hypothetical protein